MTLTTSKCLKVSKLLQGWLPTGHKRHQQNWLALSKCSCCVLDGEKQEHLVTCKDQRKQAVSFQALTTLQSRILSQMESSTTWTTFHNCLVYWLEHQKISLLHLLAVSLNPPLMVQLNDWINKIKIGWQYAFRGHLSHNWVVRSQQLEHPKFTE